MADYFGLAAIAERMGVHQRTIRHWQITRGFGIFHRWNNKTKRLVWYTNDNLIFAWETAQCRIERPTPQPMDQPPPQWLTNPHRGMRGKRKKDRHPPEAQPPSPSPSAAPTGSGSPPSEPEATS